VAVEMGGGAAEVVEMVGEVLVAAATGKEEAA
jgi:hypothetical protein